MHGGGALTYAPVARGGRRVTARTGVFEMTFSNAFYAFLKGEKSQAELDAYRQAMKHINDLEAAL